jgi:hypothetical protein
MVKTVRIGRKGGMRCMMILQCPHQSGLLLVRNKLKKSKNYIFSRILLFKFNTSTNGTFVFNFTFVLGLKYVVYVDSLGIKISRGETGRV